MTYFLSSEKSCQWVPHCKWFTNQCLLVFESKQPFSLASHGLRIQIVVRDTTVAKLTDLTHRRLKRLVATMWQQWSRGHVTSSLINIPIETSPAIQPSIHHSCFRYETLVFMKTLTITTFINTIYH